MKKTGRLKQLLALILAGALTAGSVGTPVFGADFGDTAIEVAAEEEAVAEEITEETDNTVTEESAAGNVSDDAAVAEDNLDTNVESYTVTLDANGGYFANEWDDTLNEFVDSTEVLTKNIPAGERISSIPVKEQDGEEMNFLGWSLERDGEVLTQENEEYTPVDSCVLYAVWEIKENSENNFDRREDYGDLYTETEDEFGVSDYNDQSDLSVESGRDTVDSEIESEEYTDADAMKNGLINIAEEYFAFVYTGYNGTYVVDNIYYTGSPVYPYIMVTGNELRSWIDNLDSSGGMVLIGLQENEDYTVSYSDNIEVGEATVTINGTGKYTGTIVTHFEIEKAPAELTFNEQFISKTIDDVSFTNPLSSVSNADVVYYSDNEDVASVDASTGMVTIHTPGSTIIRAFVEENDHYQSGEAAFLLEVDGSLGEDITWFLDGDGTLKISGTGRVYAFGENHPWDNNAVSTIMILGDIQNIPDYAFKGCINLGEVCIPYSVTEIGQHAFDDCPNVHFTCEYDSYAAQYASEHGITRCDPLPAVDPVFDDPDPDDPLDRPDPETHDISYCTITLDPVDYTYDGIEKEPSVTVSDGGTILSVDTDYTVDYKNNINAGTATVTITGAGDYSGTKDEYFTISRALPVLSFSNSEIEKKTTDNPFTNKLSITTDGSVSYVSDNPSVASVDVNTGNVTIQGKAGNAVIKVLTGQGKNYTAGTASYSLKVTRVNLSGFSFTLPSGSLIYNGQAREPDVTVKNGTIELIKDTDYTTSYSDNVNAGTATCIVTGINKYTGSASITFTIKKAYPVLTFASTSVSKKTTDSAFTNTLTKTTDGTVTFSSSNTSVATVNSSSGQVTIKGTGSTTITVNAAAGNNYYAGSASYSLTVSARSLFDCTMTISPTSYTYDGTAKKPTVTIKYNSTNLTNNTDYTVSYSNNTNAGTGTVTATGKGGYSGTLSKTFTISKASPTLSFASSSISKTTTDSSFTNTLTKTTDGTVTFSSSNTSVATVNSSSGQVTIKGTGNTTITANAAEGNNYKAGSASYSLTVSALSLSDCTMTISPTSYTYDGTEKKPTVTIKYNSTNLTTNTDYTVSYSNNINAGTGTVTATGKGSYSGTLSKTFTIGKASPTLSFASSSVSKKTTDSAFTNTLTKKTDGTVTFSSSNTSVATVNSSSGQVTIKGAGSTTITANAAAGTNYNAGSASYTLTVTNPATSAFLWGRDNWNFRNSRYDGFTSDQYISQIKPSYVNKLIESFIENDDNKAYQKVFNVENGNIYDDWKGSCHGMSSLVLLSNNGYLPYSDYKPGASTLYELDMPKDNIDISSLITYYQLLQAIEAQQQHFRYNLGQTNSENINNIISLLSSNHTVLVGYQKADWGGHTVVAYDLEYGSYTWNGITYQGCIKICDPNSSRQYDDKYNIYFNKNTYNWAIPNYSNGEFMSTKGAKINLVVADAEIINEGGYLSGGISGNNTDFIARLDAYEISDDRSIRKVIENNGNYNTVSGGSDDIVEDYSFISTGNNGKGVLGYNLYDSDSAYRVSQIIPDKAKLKMDYSNCYLEAESQAANSVIFDKKGFISIDSESADYNMAMTFNKDYPTDWFTIEVSGTGANEASLTKQSNGYLLTSDNLTNIQVDANNQEEDVHVYASTSEQEVFICETDGMLDVRADLDHNGTFETSVSGKADLSKAVVTSLASETYNGSPLTPLPEVKMNGWVLKQGTDYTVNYKNNINAGTATVVITGTGNYEGVITESFTINKAIQSIKASDMTLTFLKTATITASGNKGKLTYKSDNTSVATVDTTGKVTAKGVGTTTISITAAATSNYNAAMKAIAVKVSKADQSITAKAAASPIAVGKTTTVSISGAKGAKSFKSSDTTIATVSSTGKVTAKKVGKVTITATSAATANYKAASKTVTIKVVPAATTSFTAANQATGIKLTWKKVAGANAYFIYRGSTQIAAIKNGSTVTYMDKKATSNGTKYTYKIIASASATGRSTLSKSVTTYCMARPAISTLTNSAASKMTVKWGKNAKATGYQIQYCPDKTFKTGNKSVSINSASTVSKVIGSLAKDKTYYVRIRTYKTAGSTKYFSAWGAVKSVKISK